MLLNSINRYYWIIGIVLYSLFSISNISDVNFMFMHVVSFCAFLLYGIVIYKSSLQSNRFFKKENLAVIVLSISIIEVSLFQLLSFHIDGDTFVFSKADAIGYYTVGVKMSQMPISDGFHYMSDVLGAGFDDWGAFLWISTMFRIIPSQQFLSFSYCVVSTISALMLFDIGRNFMPRKYAFMSALSFSLASFIVVHHALCLKETFMVACIIASFDGFVTFVRKRRKRFLYLAVFSVLLVFLFRVPTGLLLFFSLGLTLVLLYLKGPVGITLVVVFALAISSTSLFAFTYNRYLRGGDTEAILERKNELAGGGGIVNQLADPVAALTGPFPSIRTKTIKITPLYTSGLLYRFLLSAPFFLGTFYIIKKRYVKLYPFVIFFLVNAIGVAISVKGLETRLSIPHLAMMYIVAFWFLAKVDYNQFSWTIHRKWVSAYCLGIFGLCLLWNLR